MDLIPNHARGRVEPGAVHSLHASPDEINLYDELLTFSELSPEERSLEPDHFNEQKATQPSEHTEKGSLRTQPLTRTQSTIEPLPTQPFTQEQSEPDTSDQATDEVEAQDAPLEPRYETQPTTEFGDSGPLGALSLEFQYTGALSGGVCLGCGAESGAEDLFCITCGAFVDEATFPSPSISVCAECGLDACADEIFCPECGSVATA
jgi:hypothetical protein